ncbi:MAG: DHH family phosphoesterase, partial [Candidatus Bathyarchaeia archaeon]
TERGELKISARVHENLVGMGLHMGQVMQNAAEQTNGRGGGHNVAAGATIPVSMLNEFTQKVNQLVEDVISHSHS